MRGHVQIREMRRCGYKPRTVFIWDMDYSPDGWFLAAEQTSEIGTDAEIHISPSEAIESLDMRFLVGVDVHVASNDLNRLRGLYSLLKRCCVASLTMSDGKTMTYYEEFKK